MASSERDTFFATLHQLRQTTTFPSGRSACRPVAAKAQKEHRLERKRELLAHAEK